jgi:hypothetical protein
MFKNKIQNSKFKIQKFEKGVSLYLVILVSTFILAVALGLSTILISRIKVSREIGYSVVAFYAADTGIERVLKNRDDPTGLNGTTETLNLNGTFATYTIEVFLPGPDCSANNYCVKSTGIYQGVRRKIEVNY